MQIERLLAGIKQSVMQDVGAPSMERVGCNGSLKQFLSAHVSTGGDDPRVAPSQGLMNAGVRLDRSVETPKKRDVRNYAMMYANQAVSTEKARGVKRSREQLRAARADHEVNFSLLPVEERRAFISKIDEERRNRVPVADGDVADGAAADGWKRSATMGRKFWGLGSPQMPLSSDNFVGEVLRIAFVHCTISLPDSWIPQVDDLSIR